MQIHNNLIGSIARTYTRQTGALPGAGDGGLTARGSIGRPRTDSVSLSGTSQELKRVRDMVTSQPDVRAERVAALKASIANGTYQIDNTALAEKMLDRILG